MTRWEHVDLENAVWFVPATNTKTRVDWYVFLSDFALRHFRLLHKATGESQWCYPSSSGTEHVSVKSVSKQVGDRQVRFKKRKPLSRRRHDDSLVLGDGRNGEWTPHDLRRTAATMMQALAVSPESSIDAKTTSYQAARCDVTTCTTTTPRRREPLGKHRVYISTASWPIQA
jgi:integrase